MPEVTETPQRTEAEDIRAVQDNAMAEGAKRALEAEKKRRSDIRALFEKHGDYGQLRDQCLDNPETNVGEARKLLLEAIGNREEPVATNQRIEIGDTDVEKFSRAAEDAIAFRAGIAAKDAKPTELVGYMARSIERARRNL